MSTPFTTDYVVYVLVQSSFHPFGHRYWILVNMLLMLMIKII